jgi:hypothetical protein
MINNNNNIFNNEIDDFSSEWKIVKLKCNLGKKCSNEFCSKTHPNTWNWQMNVMCDFPNICAKKDCKFIHNEGHSWEKYTLCEFGAKCTLSRCTVSRCKFEHKCNLYDCIGEKCIYDHKHEHCIKGVKSICNEIGCMPCRHCKCKSSPHDDGLCKSCSDKETDKYELQDSMEYYYRCKYNKR